MASSPMQRSLAYLRQGGWLAEVVEHRVPKTFITRDLFGCADILAARPGRRPMLVQTTSAGNVSARVAKIRALEHLPELLVTFNIEVHGWAKPTKTLRRWRLRVVTIAPEVIDHGELQC